MHEKTIVKLVYWARRKIQIAVVISVIVVTYRKRIESSV